MVEIQQLFMRGGRKKKKGGGGKKLSPAHPEIFSSLALRKKSGAFAKSHREKEEKEKGGERGGGVSRLPPTFPIEAKTNVEKEKKRGGEKTRPWL